jgi:hypothetical protein
LSPSPSSFGSPNVTFALSVPHSNPRRRRAVPCSGARAARGGRRPSPGSLLPAVGLFSCRHYSPVDPPTSFTVPTCCLSWWVPLPLCTLDVPVRSFLSHIRVSPVISPLSLLGSSVGMSVYACSLRSLLLGWLHFEAIYRYIVSPSLLLSCFTPHLCLLASVGAILRCHLHD